jgi:hypothetical protein
LYDGAHVGASSTIVITISVHNTGSVTTRVDLTMRTGRNETCTIAPPIDPSAFGSCNLARRVLQSDVDASEATQTSAVRVTNDEGLVDALDAYFNVLVTASIALDTISNATAATVAGTRVDIAVRVANTGSYTLHDVRVDDVIAFECPTTALPPGQTTVCHATYAVTQQDLDAGQFVLSPAVPAASASSVTSRDDVFIALPASARLELTVSRARPATFQAGQTLRYVARVHNTGTQTLRDILVRLLPLQNVHNVQSSAR